MSLLNDKVSNKPFVYMWQYNANNVNNGILTNGILKKHLRLLESHLHILQNNKGFLYYIGIHDGNNIRYAHSSDTVEALGLPKEVDYDNLPPGWKRRIIFIGETYKQVQDVEAKLIKKAYDDHDWNNYLNKAFVTGGHLFGGAGETHPKYKDGKRGGANRYDPEVHSAYQKERYQENIKDPEWVKKQSAYQKEYYYENQDKILEQSRESYQEKMEDTEYRKKYYARKKRERLARKKRQIEEATPSFDRSILKYLYTSESVYLVKDKLI